MINVKKFTPPILVLTGVMCLSACALEEQTEPAEEAYTKAFIKEFGLIASDQDWNMATQGSVTVNTGSATNVKIYALVDGTYRLVGNYADVTGTQTLTFDIPKGVEDIRVENPTYSFNVKVGETVSFVGTRGMVASSDDSNVKVEDAGKEITLDESDAKVYRNKLPEGKNNLKRDGIVKNFSFTGVKELTIYPIYWQTSQTLTLGIYYKNASDNIVHVPVYTIKDTDKETARLLVKANSEAEDGTEYFIYNSKGVKDKKNNTPNSTYLSIIKEKISQNSWKNGSLTEAEKTTITDILSKAFGVDRNYTFTLSLSDLTNWTESGTTVYGGKFTYTYHRDAVEETEYHVFTDAKETTATLPNWSISEDFEGEILSKGIKVTVPSNLVFGMYITYKDSKNKDIYFYSQKSENKATDSECHAVTYVDGSSKERYLGFEDWPNTDTNNNPSDFDLNDIIVRLDITTAGETTDTGIKDEDESSKTETANGWIIACEDLGSTDDFDFNDIVFKVTHVSGETSVTITPLAAGGVLKAEIYWNNDKLNSKKLIGEIHELLGAEPTSTGSYPMINTYSITNSGEEIVRTDASNIGGDYSIENQKKTGNLGKFYIMVYKNSTEQAYTITAPRVGGAPQMFVVPDSWKWPKERVDIRDAYPDFKKWGTDNTEKEYNWYTNRADATGEVVER